MNKTDLDINKSSLKKAPKPAARKKAILCKKEGENQPLFENKDDNVLELDDKNNKPKIKSSKTVINKSPSQVKTKSSPKNKVKKPKKFCFKLTGLDIEDIERRYKLPTKNTCFNKMTSIVELEQNNKDSSMDVLSFLDESRRSFNCIVSMIDFRTHESTETLKNYHCYWDRNPFSNIPIGCPIRYVSSKAIKTYHSEVSKDNYSIKEYITDSRCQLLMNKDKFISKDKAEINTTQQSHFITDGIFCSFNCVKAFINDNKHNSIYNHSETLLLKMYLQINNQDQCNTVVINEAPHWRMLKSYGGPYSIDEFRQKFNRSIYENQGTMTSKILFNPIGNVYEEKISF